MYGGKVNSLEDRLLRNIMNNIKHTQNFLIKILIKILIKMQINIKNKLIIRLNNINLKHYLIINIHLSHHFNNHPYHLLIQNILIIINNYILNISIIKC